MKLREVVEFLSPSINYTYTVSDVMKICTVTMLYNSKAMQNVTN